MAAENGQKPQIVVRSKDATFNKPLKWQREAEQGLRPTLANRLIFTCSWSDWNNPEADEWRPEAWDIVRRCPDLIFQILTKLPQRMPDHLPSYWDEIKERCWVGVSAGYQEAADEMIKYLRLIDAPHRFVSYEPSLGLVDWSEYAGVIDWLISGGESDGGQSPYARPSHIEWFRRARDWALTNGVAFHHKQNGEWISKVEVATFNRKADFGSGWEVKPEWRQVIKGSRWGCLSIDGKYLPETTTWNGRQNDPQDDYEVIVYKVGKHAAGRLLDGIEWNQFPEVKVVPQGDPQGL